MKNKIVIPDFRKFNEEIEYLADTPSMKFDGFSWVPMYGHKMWVVYTFASPGSEDRFKSKPHQEEMINLVNIILGGHKGGESNEEIAKSIAGIFEKEQDALKFYDSLQYREEE